MNDVRDGKGKRKRDSGGETKESKMQSILDKKRIMEDDVKNVNAELLCAAK